MELTREEFKQRIYDALELTEDEREIADAMPNQWELARAREAAFKERLREHAQVVSEQLTEQFLSEHPEWRVEFNSEPLA